MQRLAQAGYIEISGLSESFVMRGFFHQVRHYHSLPRGRRPNRRRRQKIQNDCSGCERTGTVRNVFIIDPNQIIRAILNCKDWFWCYKELPATEDTHKKSLSKPNFRLRE
jgi:hypothetical protein